MSRLIQLKTSDAKIIKLEPFYLQANSSVFRDSLSLPQPSPTDHDGNIGTASTPIDITITYRVAAVLVQLLRGNTSINPTMLSWSEYVALDGFLEAYEFSLLKTLVYGQRKKWFTGVPWDIFCHASHHNDLTLAKEALQHMDNDTTIGRDLYKALNMARVNQCALPYLIGLIKAYDKPSSSTNFVTPWLTISTRFRPSE